MADQISIQFPKTIVYEDSSFTATLTFRDRATGAASTPTNIWYRVDGLTSGQVITEWTEIAVPSTSNSLTITPAMNDFKSGYNTQRERKQLVVQVDRGLSTQVTQAKNWQVQNLQGIL